MPSCSFHYCSVKTLRRLWRIQPFYIADPVGAVNGLGHDQHRLHKQIPGLSADSAHHPRIDAILHWLLVPRTAWPIPSRRQIFFWKRFDASPSSWTELRFSSLHWWCLGSDTMPSRMTMDLPFTMQDVFMTMGDCVCSEKPTAAPATWIGGTEVG